MRNLWWGIFFGSLVGVLLLSPNSNFSTKVRGLLHEVQITFAKMTGDAGAVFVAEKEEETTP